MKIDKKTLYLLAGSVVVGPVIGTLLFVYLLSPFFQAKPSIVRISSPVSLAEARRKLAMPLPDEASNVVYAGYPKSASYKFMLKFEAPEAVCKRYAIDLLAQVLSKTQDTTTSIDLRVISVSPDPVPATPPFNVNWFDVHNIKNGFVAGGDGSDEPAVWIDSDRKLFYYIYTD